MGCTFSLVFGGFGGGTTPIFSVMKDGLFMMFVARSMIHGGIILEFIYGKLMLSALVIVLLELCLAFGLVCLLRGILASSTFGAKQTLWEFGIWFHLPLLPSSMCMLQSWQTYQEFSNSDGRCGRTLPRKCWTTCMQIGQEQVLLDCTCVCSFYFQHTKKINNLKYRIKILDFFCSLIKCIFTN